MISDYMPVTSVTDCVKMYKIKNIRESLKINKLNDCFYIYLFETEFMSNINKTVF